MLKPSEITGSRLDAQAPTCRWVDWRVCIGAIVVFVAAVPIFPLYTINQNTKFLHGLAQAFPDRLGADWTAATVDGLPVFSNFVFLVARFGNPLLFHATELVLLGCFVSALLAIGAQTSPSSGTSLWFQTALAAIIVVFAKKHGFDGVAIEYLIGGYLQPSEFGILFIVALALALYGHRTSAVLASAAPAALLPAYIPIAAIIVGSIVIVGWRDHRALPPPLVSVIVLALLIVPPADLALRFAPTDPDLFARATRILAIERVPYHSIVSVWFDATAFVKLLLAIVALGLAPRGLLRFTLGGLFIYAVGGTIIAITTNYSGLMILAPWRASVIIVPVSIVILVARLLDGTMPLMNRTIVALGLAPRELLRFTLGGLFIYAVGGTIIAITSNYSDLMILAPWGASVIIVPVSIVILVARLLDGTMPLMNRKGCTVLITALLLVAVFSAAQGLHAKYWRYIAARPPDYVLFVREHHEPTDLYLTDPSDMTFRLAAMTAQFVSWKTHPYLDREVIEWKHRVNLANAVFTDINDALRINCDALRSLLDAYPVTHVLLDDRRVDQKSTCAFLKTWFVGQEARIMSVNRSALGSY